MFTICKDLFFGHVFINLVEVVGLKQLQQEVGVALHSDKDTDDLGVVTQVDLIRT